MIKSRDLYNFPINGKSITVFGPDTDAKSVANLRELSNLKNHMLVYIEPSILLSKIPSVLIGNTLSDAILKYYKGKGTNNIKYFFSFSEKSTVKEVYNVPLITKKYLSSSFKYLTKDINAKVKLFCNSLSFIALQNPTSVSIYGSSLPVNADLKYADIWKSFITSLFKLRSKGIDIDVSNDLHKDKIEYILSLCEKLKNLESVFSAFFEESKLAPSVPILDKKKSSSTMVAEFKPSVLIKRNIVLESFSYYSGQYNKFISLNHEQQ